MYTLEDAFQSLFEVNMGVRPGERILVFSDMIRPGEHPSAEEADRRRRLFEVARDAAAYGDRVFGNCRFVSYDATEASGAEPPEELWRGAFGDTIVDVLAGEGILAALLAKRASAEQLARAAEVVLAAKGDTVDVVIALANNSTSHTRFRSLLNQAGCRFASLPHFDPEMFFTSMRVDWHLLAKRTKSLAERINRAVEIRVETGNGTRMRFGKKGRTAAGDDGLLTAPGSFGNLPAGEVYLAPVEGTSEGVMILEYAPMRKLSAPLELIVREGRVTEIRGEEPFRAVLEETFGRSPLNRNIAELGIGTNDRASRPDNILEAEKILGTIHIALGDNSSFGGTVSTPFHEDYVFYGPTVTALFEDGTSDLLLEDGKLLV
ncbi:MAG TPA: aminopeptidase [Geobacteraceae bacterium]|nr:aminopeptidase [Geobacteraceae bacterium]